MAAAASRAPDISGQTLAALRAAASGPLEIYGVSVGSYVGLVLSRWWVPGSVGLGIPSSANALVLLGDDNEWLLLPDGCLLASTAWGADDWPAIWEVPALHGLEDGDRAASLLDARVVSVSPGSSSDGGTVSGRSETWQAHWFASGDAHVEPDTVASLVEIEFNVLPVWANHARVKSGAMGAPLKHFSDPSLLPPNESIAAIVDGVEVSLVIRWKVVNDGPPIVAEADACFQLRGAVPLRDIRDKWLLPLQRLSQFFALYEVSLTRLTAYVNEPEEALGLKVEISYSDLPTTTDQHWSLDGNCMLATRETLHEAGLAVGELLERWFRFDGTYCSVICDFLTSTSPQLDADVRVYFAHRCAESFHELRIGGTARDPEAHELIVRGVEEVLPGTQLALDDKQWVLQRLRDGNRKSQARKLNDLVDLAGSTGELVMREQPQFVRQAIKSRNLSIHADHAGNSSRDPFDGSAHALWWVLRHAFLRELGVDEHQIGDLLRKSQEFRFFTHVVSRN